MTSELKVIIANTKVIRRGNIREMDRRFCRGNNLDWVNEFTALVIDYNMRDFHNVTLLNINTKLEGMQKIIQY